MESKNLVGPEGHDYAKSCALDMENTETVNNASRGTSVPTRVRSTAEISGSPDSGTGSKVDGENKYHVENNVNEDSFRKYLTHKLGNLSIHSDSVPTSHLTEKGSTVLRTSPANQKEELFDDPSKKSSTDDLLPGASRLSVNNQDNVSSLPAEPTREIVGAESTSPQSKLNMHNDYIEKTKPVSVERTSTCETTQDIVATAVTPNLESSSHAIDSTSVMDNDNVHIHVKAECQPADVYLNVKQRETDRSSVTESAVLCDDNVKTKYSDSELKDTNTGGNHIGISSTIQSPCANTAAAPESCRANGSMNTYQVPHKEGRHNFQTSSLGLLPNLVMQTYCRFSWKPEPIISSAPGAYNKKRRKKYEKTALDSEKLDKLITFYDKKLQLDDESEETAVDFVDGILEQILNHASMAWSSVADDEGSVTVDAKVGKLDELDYSVEILLEDEDDITLSDEPFDIEYANDDIDANTNDEIPATAFVNDRKRLFPEESRPIELTSDPVDIPEGFVAVLLGPRDALRFLNCCISTQTGVKELGWILPYELLSNFHKGIAVALQNLGLEGVTLNNGARGPAVTLTILQQDGPNISVDITPKLNIPPEKLNILDYQWPRKATRKWLTTSKIQSVCGQALYLVPKGDKYWKISFANLENEVLEDIDDNGTWRKQCLRIMKKKLIQWKSKSRAGLKSISSYLMKTTLLWLCEIIPKDSFWTRDQLANRYLNFLQELEHRLKKKRLGEYFIPSANLLEYKDDEDIEELRKFIQDEIEDFTK